ncbi:hypothetical protein Q75_00655 [Bacillus coahuilensis p1.1.43]|uniref:Uncharacterized protein n=1 Tax=Bacillus coahuilensis p1.1.43 TaxID=1150625 RepID=A0A147KCN7_9BACI|nr:hypothetical protein Q75_00655 [Bacillus coahuilensis p1.1.43]
MVWGSAVHKRPKSMEKSTAQGQRGAQTPKLNGEEHRVRPARCTNSQAQLRRAPRKASAVHKRPSSTEKSTTRGQRDAQTPELNGEEHRARPARCTNARDQRRRAPREASAVHKRPRPTEKSTARGQRGAQTPEINGEVHRALQQATKTSLFKHNNYSGFFSLIDIVLLALF